VVTAGPGRHVFVAGQVALDANGQVVGKGDIVAQTRQVMENLRLALEAAGAGFADVVKVVNYITDVELFGQMAEVRKEFLVEPFPVSTLVEVPALIFPDLLIEIEAIAVVADG
jgi:enamine deaminase RidA (YjgF/YER057c/UK114 family)